MYLTEMFFLALRYRKYLVFIFVAIFTRHLRKKNAEEIAFLRNQHSKEVIAYCVPCKEKIRGF